MAPSIYNKSRTEVGGEAAGLMLLIAGALIVAATLLAVVGSTLFGDHRSGIL